MLHFIPSETAGTRLVVVEHSSEPARFVMQTMAACDVGHR